MHRNRTQIFCLSRSGLELASTIGAKTGGAVRIPGSMATQGNSLAFESFPTALREAFLAGSPVIGICATGILFRIIGPLIGRKREDPPVVSVAEDGSSVVPLLGGHDGANAIAVEIADHIGAHAAITTASDLILGVSLDTPPEGWRLAGPADTKSMTLSILAGERVRVSRNLPWLRPLLALKNVTLDDSPDQDAPLVIKAERGTRLVYHQQRYVIGAGCSRNCPPDELISLIDRSLISAGIAPESIRGIWSASIKSDEPALHALSRHLDAPVRFFSTKRLESETPRLANPSDQVFAAIGAHGVAEAASLAAAGPDSTLVVEKRKSSAATCAVARMGASAGAAGHLRGRLSITGIGPGNPEFRTVQAIRAIASADHVVGYRSYLEQIASLTTGSECTSFALGEEIDRCRFAIETAATGKHVALVCSGDSGIYAMASPVMELLAEPDRYDISSAGRRIEVEIVPGVSAMQAASALAGAIIGNDFCAISLSDLLTPAPVVRDRIVAALSGDFVIALYNPASRTRREMIIEAFRAIRKHRHPSTPVLVARNVGRADQNWSIKALDHVDIDAIDMFTTIIVGSSRSRTLAIGKDGERVFTPRGYRDPVQR